MNTPEPAHEHHWTPWIYSHESYEGERTFVCSCGMTETRKFVHRDTPEPNWQELESALWAARSQTNEIANRGIDRIVYFFKKLHADNENGFRATWEHFLSHQKRIEALESKLHEQKPEPTELPYPSIEFANAVEARERTEPSVCHCSCKDGQRACESWKEAATQDVADSLRKTGLFSSVTIGVLAPDLTEEELNALFMLAAGHTPMPIRNTDLTPEKAQLLLRLISELRRRRKEDATEPQKAFDRGARCERSRMSVEAKEKDSKVHLSYCTCWCGAKH